MPDAAPLLTERDLTDEDRRILAEIASRKSKRTEKIAEVQSGRFVEIPDTETEEQRFSRIMQTPSAWTR
jgi:hypothetical protein